jgi:HEPN domain-containing protein
LLYLSSVCRKTIDLKDFRKSLRRLSEAYIPARYPSNSYIRASKEEAKKCLKDAKEIIDFIKKKLDLSTYYQETPAKEC